MSKSPLTPGLMKHQILFQTPWFNVASYRDYQFFFQPKPTVAVLPIDMKTGKCLLRLEDLPCWQVNHEEDQLLLTAVTGGGNPGEDLMVVVLRELKEETGIEPVRYDVVSEGPMQVGKWTNMTVTFYVLYLHEYTQGQPQPDPGFEERARNLWVPVDQALEYEKDLLLNYLFACVDLSLFMEKPDASSNPAA